MQRVSRASTQSVVYSSRSHRIIRERERDHPAKMPRHIKNNWNGYVEKNGRRLTAAVSGERRVSDAVFSYYIHDEPEREREREIIHNSSQVHQVTSRNKKKKTKIAPTVWVRYGPVAIQTEGKTTSSWFPSTTPRFFLSIKAALENRQPTINCDVIVWNLPPTVLQDTTSCLTEEYLSDFWCLELSHA